MLEAELEFFIGLSGKKEPLCRASWGEMKPEQRSSIASGSGKNTQSFGVFAMWKNLFEYF